MNLDMSAVVFAFLAGVVLGLFYFGGLWLTLRRIHHIRHPGTLLFASFLVRMAVVLPAFYVVMDGVWQRFVPCFVGFLIVRFALIHWIRPADLGHTSDGRTLT